MADIVTETELRKLREGDRLKYHGVQWMVKDYSTYTDPQGYETEEWLITSQTGKEYYLMREVDPNNPDALVHWYVAEELRNPAIYEPNSSRDLATTLAMDMRSHKEPYPELRLFNRIYQFESQTEGQYESDGQMRSRTTWDYWDATHLWNLALEAWSDRTLVVYSTREVQPADFSEIRPGIGFATTSGFQPIHSRSNTNTARSLQIVLAWFITILGFFLMISGI